MIRFLQRCPTIAKPRRLRALAVALVAALAACSRGAAVLPPPGTDSNAEARSSSSGYASIYSFGQNGKANDGSRPSANLVNLHGSFYGTTQHGGTTNSQCALGCGTVFRITSGGTETVIYRFKGGADGANPTAGLVAMNGSFFGTTTAGGGANACSGGCGTVFKLAANGKTEKILHSFSGSADGAQPVAPLVLLSGTFYGTTTFGGTVTHLCTAGCGTVFEIAPSGNESVAYRFKGGSDGEYPASGLLELHGALYGTTQYGGAVTRFCATGCGTIFKIAGGVKKTLHAFKYGAAADGAYPAASVVGIGTELYGTTAGGGKHGDGAVFAASSTSGNEKLLHSFECCQTVKDGSYPLAALTVVRGTLYGTTSEGGGGNNGTVFVVTTSGAESLLYQFAGQPDGQSPQAALFLSGDLLYGTTAGGGSASLGSVFTVAP